MKILALEFSSEQRSVAVAELQNSTFKLLSSASEIGGRSTRAIGLIEKVLSEAQLERENVNCIAIGIGPGSYTGIRAALALAQGWQLSKNIKCIGISSVEALVRGAQKNRLFGTANIEVDAQRNEFYLARYQVSETSIRAIETLHLTSAERLQQLSQAGEIICGPEAERFPNGKKMFPEAAMVAELASARTDYISAELIEPIYLRETNFVKAPPARVI